MVDGSGWAIALSFGQAWIPACLLSALWCALRANRQGYRKAQYCALGLLLGPGAIPVVWLATRKERLPSMGTGLNRVTPDPQDEVSIRPCDELWRECGELRLGLVLGVAGGFLLNFCQAMTHFLTRLFLVDGHHQAVTHSSIDFEWWFRGLWMVVALTGPSLGYFALLGRKSTDTQAGASESDRVRLERQILGWSPRTVPLLLVLFFVLVLVFYVLGALALQNLL